MSVSLPRGALLTAAKDLRVERHAKVALGQMLPFAILVLILFAFALDPDRGVLNRATPGLFWLTVIFTSTLAVQRSFEIEVSDGALDGLRLSGISPSSVFLGKAIALMAQLLVLELFMAVGVAILYNQTFGGWVLLGTVTILSTIGIAAAGATYGVLVSRLRHSATLLPLLLLPLLAPVLISATKGTEVALGYEAGGGWSWAALLGVFALAYLILGMVLYHPLLEDS